MLPTFAERRRNIPTFYSHHQIASVSAIPSSATGLSVPRLVSQRDLVNSSRRCASRAFLNTDLSALDRVWSQKLTSDRCKRVSVTPPLRKVMGWAVRS
jgi:hypothetical protein